MATEPDLHFSDATWWHLVTESTHSFCLLKFAFYLSIILHLGFLRNSTLVDTWTRNQGRQSARTVNVSENKKKRFVQTVHELDSVPQANAKRRRYVTCEVDHPLLRPVVQKVLGVFKISLFVLRCTEK